ncbi:MAG: thermonuclease family protein [Syntrophobacteraceae bacterium]
MELGPFGKDGSLMILFRKLARSFPRSKPIRLIAVLLTGFSLCVWSIGSRSSSAGPPTSGMVSAVFDGDTVQLQSGERVRYLGLDAPEVAHNGTAGDCFGEEAKRANRDLVLHKRVTLQFDHERKDRHGRLLAYVMLSDGRSVNGELIRAGYAHVFRSVEGFTRFGDYVALQRDAIENRRGMWGACRERPARFYITNRSSGVFHRAGCRFGRSTSIRNAIRFETRWAALMEGFSPCRRCNP